MSGITNLDKSIWDLSSFSGRVKYYAWITDPRLGLTPTSTLYRNKELVLSYRRDGVLPTGVSVEEFRKAQQTTLSAFHPSSGQLQNVMGRMSFQVPGGMVLCGCMVAFYRSAAAVIFWQWTNQTFNALVNYTNAPDSTSDNKKLFFAYATATSSACATALGLKAFLAKRASPLLQRYVPFVAVAAANFVNIPLMRQNELLEGVPVKDEDSNYAGKSKYAAAKGILQVFISRIFIAGPCMTLLPPVIDGLEKLSWWQKYGAKFNVPFQVLFCGVVMMITVPVGCALFNQNCSITTERLKTVEPKVYEQMKQKYGDSLPPVVYFNKGL